MYHPVVFDEVSWCTAPRFIRGKEVINILHTKKKNLGVLHVPTRKRFIFRITCCADRRIQYPVPLFRCESSMKKIMPLASIQPFLQAAFCPCCSLVHIVVLLYIQHIPANQQCLISFTLQYLPFNRLYIAFHLGIVAKENVPVIQYYQSDTFWLSKHLSMCQWRF